MSPTGSRRLLTYRRVRDNEVSVDALAAYGVQRLELQEAHRTGIGGTANDLNDFRKKVCNDSCAHFDRCGLLIVFSDYSTSKGSGRLDQSQMMRSSQHLDATLKARRKRRGRRLALLLSLHKNTIQDVKDETLREDELCVA